MISNTAQPFSLFDEGAPALLMIILQALLNTIFFIINSITKKTKQVINGGKIGEIKHRSRKIRYFLSAGLVILSIYLNIALMLTAFSMSHIISQSFMTINILASSIVPIILTAVLLLVIIRRLKEDNYLPASETETQVVNRADDKYYLFGSIYYNKSDPALFVEKRVGIGSTLNFAKPGAKIFMGVITAIIVGALVLVALIPGMTRERQIEVNKDMISVSGTWGTELRKDEIDSIIIQSEFPAVLMKTDGADIGNKLYGHHRLEGYDDALLFIADYTKPYIAVYLKDGRLVLINFKDNARTEELYQKIRSTMHIK